MWNTMDEGVNCLIEAWSQINAGSLAVPLKSIVTWYFVELQCRSKCYVASFKFKTVDCAETKPKEAAAREFGVDGYLD